MPRSIVRDSGIHAHPRSQRRDAGRHRGCTCARSPRKRRSPASVSTGPGSSGAIEAGSMMGPERGVVAPGATGAGPARGWGSSPRDGATRTGVGGTIVGGSGSAGVDSNGAAIRSSGVRQTKPSSAPEGETGAQRSLMTPSATQALSRGARAARPSHSRTAPRSSSASSMSAISRQTRRVGRPFGESEAMSGAIAARAAEISCVSSAARPTVRDDSGS